MPLGVPVVAQYKPSCPFTCEQRCITTVHSSVQVRKASGAARTQLPHLAITSRRLSKPDTHCSAAVSPPELAAHRKPRLAFFVSGGGSNFRSIHAAILDGHIQADVAVRLPSSSGSMTPAFLLPVTVRHPPCAQVVISDVPGCGGWEHAASHGIPTEVYPAPSQPAAHCRQQPLSIEALVTALKGRYAVDYVLLAGYVKVSRWWPPCKTACCMHLLTTPPCVQLVPEELVRRYKRAMLNIHPALLPAFGGKGYYGSRVHRAVIASGTRFSGPTIHFVDEGCAPLSFPWGMHHQGRMCALSQSWRCRYDTGPILAQAVVPVSPTDTPKQLAARVLKEVRRHAMLHAFLIPAMVTSKPFSAAPAGAQAVPAGSGSAGGRQSELASRWHPCHVDSTMRPCKDEQCLKNLSQSCPAVLDCKIPVLGWQLACCEVTHVHDAMPSCQSQGCTVLDLWLGPPLARLPTMHHLLHGGGRGCPLVA